LQSPSYAPPLLPLTPPPTLTVDPPLAGECVVEKVSPKAKAPEYPERFEAIWDGTGKSGNKFPAFIAWKKVGQPEPDLVIARWKAWKETPKWRAGFVPHLSTWLNARGFEDEPPSPQTTKTNGEARNVVRPPPGWLAAWAGETSR
jgi:hypothetical protein